MELVDRTKIPIECQAPKTTEKVCDSNCRKCKYAIIFVEDVFGDDVTVFTSVPDSTCR